MKKGFTKGFTLIELMVVISIIGMLSSVVLASLNKARDKGKIAADATFNNHIRSALYNEKKDNISFNFNEGPSGENIIARSESNNSQFVTLQNSAMFYSVTPLNNGYSLKSTDGNTYATFSWSVDVTGPTTFSFWVNTVSVADQVIFSNRRNSGTMFLGTQNGKVFIYTNGSNLSTNTISDGKWRHVTVSYSGVNAPMIIYIDGKKETIVGSTINTPVNSTAPSSDFFFNDSVPAYSFVGSIDDFRVFKNQLSSRDVDEIYAEGLPSHTLAKAQ